MTLGASTYLETLQRMMKPTTKGCSAESIWWQLTFQEESSLKLARTDCIVALFFAYFDGLVHERTW